MFFQLRRLHAPFMSVFTRIRSDDGYNGHISWTSCAGAKRSKKQQKWLIREISTTPEENPPRLDFTARLTTNYTAGPFWSARIVAPV